MKKADILLGRKELGELWMGFPSAWKSPQCLHRKVYSQGYPSLASSQLLGMLPDSGGLRIQAVPVTVVVPNSPQNSRLGKLSQEHSHRRGWGLSQMVAACCLFGVFPTARCLVETSFCFLLVVYTLIIHAINWCSLNVFKELMCLFLWRGWYSVLHFGQRNSRGST